ncbi:MAG TPA: hypothetical protein VFF03_19490 [Rhodocyclaceae bacterium]|nr:hypothetical protein [Rhodocyclaceae bacterium]
MASSDQTSIPNRAETLRVLRMMGDYAPILMLGSDGDDVGTRWLLHGHPIQPAIARYLMRLQFVEDSGHTEFGARTLALTPRGIRFREDGVAWWSGLSWFQKLWVTVFG